MLRFGVAFVVFLLTAWSALALRPRGYAAGLRSPSGRIA